MDISKTLFKGSEPEKYKYNKTYGQKVLHEMMQEPGLNEKIFKMFSKLNKKDDEDDELEPSSPGGLEN